MQARDAASSREYVRPATGEEVVASGRAQQVGVEWWWTVDKSWIAPPIGAGRCRYCRYMQGRQGCGQPAVATLMRPIYGSSPRRPWDYCGDHLYGRRLEDEKVLVMVARWFVEYDGKRKWSER